MTYELLHLQKPSTAAAPRRMAKLLAVLIAATACLSMFSAGSAHAADVDELCSGYSGCSIGGFTTNGYQYAQDQSWWRMYAGDNCTNYAAYVESRVYGVATPGYLLGDGADWGFSAAAHGVAVNATPTVGSVAVWDADASGMGYDGHVAIVQSVGPNASYVDISQSGLGSADDGYNWERVYADDSGWEQWPSSFIHFAGSRMPGTEHVVPVLARVSDFGIPVMRAGIGTWSTS